MTLNAELREALLRDLRKGDSTLEVATRWHAGYWQVLALRQELAATGNQADTRTHVEFAP